MANGDLWAAMAANPYYLGPAGTNRRAPDFAAQIQAAIPVTSPGLAARIANPAAPPIMTPGGVAATGYGGSRSNPVPLTGPAGEPATGGGSTRQGATGGINDSTIQTDAAPKAAPIPYGNDQIFGAVRPAATPSRYSAFTNLVQQQSPALGGPGYNAAQRQAGFLAGGGVNPAAYKPRAQPAQAAYDNANRMAAFKRPGALPVAKAQQSAPQTETLTPQAPVTPQAGGPAQTGRGTRRYG